MNAQDQADNLHASSFGPTPSLNDFDPTNHTVRERLKTSTSTIWICGRTKISYPRLSRGGTVFGPVYARKSGSRRNRLRLAYALKSSKEPFVKGHRPKEGWENFLRCTLLGT
ncbi:hypothetical protein MRS44_013587 [Fusarium solani]|uniref:uncharacterized protein n=1 Tax=Fusarium solani TaxID=169388 RepID=UPI0032C416F4|nr:hypothetical protein MRS44_013587 [Fusarium solani]